ncbi:GSCOCT00014127001.2-RA-CDS [Cotesia congregata]|uniref:Cc_ToNVorf54_1 n=1 Tax=Cotesia congregata TaxID=51543 RepID=B9W4K7_COTCN|nr:GSCOCT00014127001.2-RA-CDS [Cotesia congregata]CAG5089990.1 Cc_ToNVorf54_1 [Cotesia congregata]CAR82244.1 hypothetical protein [Cotesia congregata]
MICANKFIKDECLRDDGRPFTVLTDYFNNRIHCNRQNNNDSISDDPDNYNACTARPPIWIFLTYNKNDYTVLRYACKLNTKYYSDDPDTLDPNRSRRYIHFNPPYPINGNIIYSVAPSGLWIQLINTNFYYPLNNLSVYASTIRGVNYQILTPTYGYNSNCTNIVYDVNSDYSDVDHFKVLLSNLIWCNVKINYTIWEKCSTFITNYQKYRPLNVINKCYSCKL